MDFVGEESRSCSADLQQIGADVTATITCGEEKSTVTGTVSNQRLSLRGMFFGFAREIAAYVTQDGNAIGGTWYASSNTTSGGFIGVRNEERPDRFDLTGTWDSALAGGFPLNCDTAIKQTGTELTSVLSCGIAGTGNLAGAIDLATGAYRMDGNLFGQAITLGVLSNDGRTASGAWAVTGIVSLSGTFVATRTGQSLSLLDLTGDWNLALAGQRRDTCTANVVQAPADLTQQAVRLTARVDCNKLGTGDLSGSLTLLRNRLALRGSLNDNEFFLDGTVEADRSLIRGVWYTPLYPDGDGTDESFGCFVAVSGGLARPDACTPPDHHPLVQRSGLRAAPDPEGPASTVLSSDNIDSRRSTIAGLAGLAAGALVLGLWSAWLGWRQPH